MSDLAHLKIWDDPAIRDRKYAASLPIACSPTAISVYGIAAPTASQVPSSVPANSRRLHGSVRMIRRAPSIGKNTPKSRAARHAPN